MTAMLMFFLLASMAATFADRAVPVARWRHWFGQTLLPTQEHKGQPMDRVHVLYCELFDYVYGPSSLSAHRIGASVVSSLTGLLVVVVALGPSETIFGSVRVLPELRDIPLEDVQRVSAEFGLFITLAFFLISLNFVVDFLSLAETRFVLGHGRRRGFLGILTLTIVDLLLTATLYLLPVAAVGLYYGSTEGASDLLAMMVRNEVGWPFFGVFRRICGQN